MVIEKSRHILSNNQASDAIYSMKSSNFVLEEIEEVLDALDGVIGLVSHPHTDLQGRAEHIGEF